MGMVPHPDSPSTSAPRPAREVRRAGVERADWREFTSRWPGEWTPRWATHGVQPRFLWAPGVALAGEAALVAAVARLSGVPPTDLIRADSLRPGEHTITRWTRTWRGAPVLGQGVRVISQVGRIGGVQVRLDPIALDLQPLPGEVVLLRPRDKPTAAGMQAHLVRARTEGPFRVYTDRGGAEILRVDTRRFTSAAVEHYARTIGDAMVESPARQITVTDAAGADALTDDSGNHTLTGALELALVGPALQVEQNGRVVSAAGEDDTVLVGGEDIAQSAAMVQHHAHVVRDWLASLWPDHPWLDEVMLATVEISSGTCNAFYTAGTINFYVGDGTRCNNFGEIADVIYHEIGHGIHHYILEEGVFASDVSEGSADYISATLTGDPELAPGAYISGDSIRELDTDRVYPDDVTGESHNDGLIWGSFMWNLREQWITTYGETDGAGLADALILATLAQGPMLSDIGEAVIVADDDNGDLADGTPHACELLDLLDLHGLGLGEAGVVQFEHTQVEPQPSDATSYAVGVSILSPTRACSKLDEDTTRLWYTIDPDAAFPTDDEELAPDDPGEVPDTGADTGEVPDTGADTGEVPDTGGDGDSGDSGEDGGADTGSPPPGKEKKETHDGWSEALLGRAGEIWIGEIPRQPANTRVRYFVEVSGGDTTLRTDSGNRDPAFSFWVGDQEEVWCEGFEDDTSEWVHAGGTPRRPDVREIDQWGFGPPTDGASNPTSPYEGAAVAATNLAGDYAAYNDQFLSSPEIAIDDPGLMLLLSYRRWLSVEDGIYDQARIYANDIELWSNPATGDGSATVLDQAWVLHQLPIADVVLYDGAEGSISFDWTLESDGGLEFGGWAIDQVCITQLADVPGHYRVGDLTATDDEDSVTIRWTQPWISPLENTILLRNKEGWPTSIDDGAILDVDFSPEPGAAQEVIDPDAGPGDRWYYTLWATGSDDSGFHLDVVEGENADMGGIPEEEETTKTIDTGATIPPDEDTGSRDTGVVESAPADAEPATDPRCGCGGGALPGTVLWLMPLLTLRRRSDR